MQPDKLSRLNWILWVGLLLALPVTSFPMIANIFGGSNVAPLSLVFLLVLVFTFILPQVIKTGRLPAQITPLLLFFLAAVLSTSLGWFRNIPSFRGASLFANNLEGVLTLVTGIAFYLVTALIIQDEITLCQSLRWINIAGMLILFVSLLQALYWQLDHDYPEYLWQLQRLVSVKEMLFVRRTTGLAMEPSWLAHQLNMLFLPLWLAFTVQGRSIYGWRLFKRLSAENILLATALIVLFTTLSRIGWLTAGAILAFAFYPLLCCWVKAIAQGRSQRRGLPEGLVWAALFLGGVISLYVLGRVAAQIDPKMRAIFDFETLRRIGFMGWMSRLSLAERFMYWDVGYQVYRLYPIFGVGLGGIGFYFTRFVPSFGYGLPEIYEVIGLGAGLPNAKNLWARLLGETGILGFILFVVWLYRLAKDARFLYLHGNREFSRTFGLFGGLVLVALVLEGFSLDTFGLPYYWLSLGMVTAAWRIETQPEQV